MSVHSFLHFQGNVFQYDIPNLIFARNIFTAKLLCFDYENSRVHQRIVDFNSSYGRHIYQSVSTLQREGASAIKFEQFKNKCNQTERYSSQNESKSFRSEPPQPTHAE